MEDNCSTLEEARNQLRKAREEIDSLRNTNEKLTLTIYNLVEIMISNARSENSLINNLRECPRQITTNLSLNNQPGTSIHEAPTRLPSPSATPNNLKLGSQHL
ncbi:unnamed protein product, partial [Iphiclides podalirius]